MIFWFKTAGLLALVWVATCVAVHLARGAQPTAESVAAYARSVDLGNLRGDGRAVAIVRMEDMVNHLTFPERIQVDRNPAARDFVHALTPDEQEGFLKATLPVGFANVMEAFNAMDVAKRRELVNRALTELKRQEQEGRQIDSDPAVVQRVVDEGLKSFYSTANADVKLDLAPIIEQLQTNLRNPSAGQPLPSTGIL